MKSILLYLLILNTNILNAQNNDKTKGSNISLTDTIEINATTKKVSLTKIIEIPNTPKEEIFRRLYDWYRIAVSKMNRFKVYKKTDSSNIYYIHLIQDLSNHGLMYDSVAKPKERVIYQIYLYNYYENQKMISKDYGIGEEKATGIVLIKDNKVKIEFTDFVHIVENTGKHDGSYAFEENTPKAFKKDEWTEFRIKVLKRFQGLIDDIEKQLKSKSDMDF